MIKDAVTLTGNARSALVTGLVAGRDRRAKGHHVKELEPVQGQSPPQPQPHSLPHTLQLLPKF